MFRPAISGLWRRGILPTPGFPAQVLLYHETNLDQIHFHALPLDDTLLDYAWVAQCGMPGGQRWTLRQLRELVDVIHAHDVRIYQGMEGAWSCWPRFGTRARWPYELHPEIFITYAVGGNALYLASTAFWPTFPPGAQDPSSPIAPTRFSSMRQLADSLPTELERRLAAIVHWACKLQIRTSEGQVHGFEASDGSICAMIENIANLFYVRLDLTTSFPLAAVTHYPIKRPSPIGYVVSGSMTEKGCQVTIPPDGIVPLKLTATGSRATHGCAAKD